MNFSKLNESLSLLANVGVLVGLIFLIVEIDQSNRIALGTAETELRVIAAESNASIVENPQTAELVGKLTTLDPDLSVAETVQARFLARQMLNLWVAAESYYLQGLISDRAFEEWKTDPSKTFDELPGLVKYFEDILYGFGPGYSEMGDIFLEEVAKRRD